MREITWLKANSQRVGFYNDVVGGKSYDIDEGYFTGPLSLTSLVTLREHAMCYGASVIDRDGKKVFSWETGNESYSVTYGSTKQESHGIVYTDVLFAWDVTKG